MSKTRGKGGRRESEREKKGRREGGSGGAHFNLNFTLYTKSNTRRITD